MRRVLSLMSAAVLVLLGSAAQTHAQTYTFSGTLHGGNEIPGVVTGAAGTVTATLDVGAQTLTYRVEVYNLPSGATAAHFHVGAPGVSGPTVINFTVVTNISNDFAITGTATPSNLTARQPQGINSWEDFVQALLLGNIYVNVHSAVNPGGEIRAQLVKQ